VVPVERPRTLWQLIVQTIVLSPVAFTPHSPAHSPQLRNLSRAGRHLILRGACSSNHGIVFHLKQEGSHECRDRVWRRWARFCQGVGIPDNPFLHCLSRRESELFGRSFLALYRSAKWDQSGRITGVRTAPVVSSTVRDAAGHLAATFRDNLEPSPFHVEGSTRVLPSIRSLFQSFNAVDPPPKRQRAITPKLLRQLYQFANTGHQSPTHAHAVDIICGAFFFAMRSCEYCLTATPGRTRMITLSGILFRSKSNRKLDHSDPRLAQQAEYVTITFVDQKNGKNGLQDAA
jgi:hypothetical protein